MYCTYCGEAISDTVKFCPQCGKAQEKNNQNTKLNHSAGGVGYSPKINDPAFARYIKNSNRWSAIFSIVLALCTVIGFTIYGEKSSEMDNPEALFIGLAIGGMFLTIAAFQIIKRKRSRTWDGVVCDKKIEQKRRKRKKGKNRYYWEEYTLYSVLVRSDDEGKVYASSAENDDTVYNYYQIGDRVRHHAGLYTYEKYDKSKDTIIFCNACGSLNNIQDDCCFRCRCPLLK